MQYGRAVQDLEQNCTDRYNPLGDELAPAEAVRTHELPPQSALVFIPVFAAPLSWEFGGKAAGGDSTSRMCVFSLGRELKASEIRGNKTYFQTSLTSA